MSARRRVLVTGASGFIGRWSLGPLGAAGYEVHAVVSRNNGEAESPSLSRVDLTDFASIDALIEAVKPTHLLHFAWIATPGIYRTSPDNQRWLAASRHLLDAFKERGGIRAVMAGSCAEYDWSRGGVCNERTTPLAIDEGAAGAVTAYAQSKIAMQRTLEEAGRADGLSSAWGRIFFQYGPGEPRERLVASVIVDLLSGREAACTHGRQIRTFMHVQDVGAAFVALLDSEVQGAVNIGSGDRVSIGDLVRALGAKIGRPDLLELGARSVSPGEPPVLVPDIGRLRDEVGFHPRWSLDEGLADTIRWWRGELAAASAGAKTS